MIKRIIKETTEKYEDGKLVSQTVTKTKEDDDNTYYPYYPYSSGTCGNAGYQKNFLTTQ